MRGRCGWLVGSALCGVVALGGCGNEGAAPDAEQAAATTASSATTASAPAGPLLDGTYALSGTQSCKSMVGGGRNSRPLFDSSTLTVSGGRVIVNLRNEPLDASVTTSGDSFHINQRFDLTGNPVDASAGNASAATQLVLDLTGTSNDGGQTIEGTGYDMGVKCEYTFTGRRADGAPSTVEPLADPCTVMDSTGALVDAWSHIDASLGEPRVVSACAEPWALANFENADTKLLKLHDSIWAIADPAELCTTTSAPVPVSPPGEDDPAGRIRYSVCSPAAQPPTTTTIPAPVASEAPCTRTAIQAALPAGETVAEDPHCEGEWAAAGVAFAEDAEARYLFRSDGRAWRHASQPDACASGELGPWMNENICIHPSG